jgi:hypothetical protein
MPEHLVVADAHDGSVRRDTHVDPVVRDDFERIDPSHEAFPRIADFLTLAHFDFTRRHCLLAFS